MPPGEAAVMRLERFRLEAELRASAAELAATRTRLKASTAELAASRTRLVETAYSERRRIERDLHDSVQQDLVGLRIKLDMVAEAVKEDPNSGARMISSMGLQMDHVLEALRSLAGGSTHPCWPNAAWTKHSSQPPSAAPSQSPSTRAGLAATNRTLRSPSTSVAWKRCRTSQSTRTKRESVDSSAAENGTSSPSGPRHRQGLRRPKGDDNHGLRNMRDRIEAVGGTLTIETLTIEAKARDHDPRRHPGHGRPGPLEGNGPGRMALRSLGAQSL